MGIFRWVDDNFEPIVLSLTMGLMAVLIFLQVVMRYVFESSLVWSEELIRWLFIWMIWVGVAYAFKTGEHMRIEAFVDILPKAVRQRLETILKAVMIVFLLRITWLGIEQTTSPIIVRQSSVVLYWPFTDQKVGMMWLYATLPFGALLSVWRLAQSLWASTRSQAQEI
jgi:TRAP-type C4-dicarboxylate transport system permease small subunit